MYEPITVGLEILRLITYLALSLIPATITAYAIAAPILGRETPRIKEEIERLKEETERRLRSEKISIEEAKREIARYDKYKKDWEKWLDALSFKNMILRPCISFGIALVIAALGIYTLWITVNAIPVCISISTISIVIGVYFLGRGLIAVDRAVRLVRSPIEKGVFFDNFEKGIGPNKWTMSFGTENDIIKATNNVLHIREDGIAPAKSIQTREGFKGDYTIEVKIRCLTIRAGHNLGILIGDGYCADGNFIFMAFYEEPHGRTYYRLWKKVIGERRWNLIGNDPEKRWSFSEWYKWKIIKRRNELEWYVGQELIYKTDISFIGSPQYIIIPRLWNEATPDEGELELDYIKIDP